MKIVARNKKTGTEYVFAEKTEYGNFYSVSTERGHPQTWLIHERDVEIAENLYQPD